MKRSVILVSFISGLLFSTLAYGYTYQGDIFLDGNGGGAIGVVTTSTNNSSSSSNKDSKVQKSNKNDNSSQQRISEAERRRAMRIVEMHDPSAPNYRGVRR